MNSKEKEKTKGWVVFLSPGNDAAKNMIAPVSSLYVGHSKDEIWTLEQLNKKKNELLRPYGNASKCNISMQMMFHSRLTAVSDWVLQELEEGEHTILFYLSSKDSGSNSNSSSSSNSNGSGDKSNNQKSKKKTPKKGKGNGVKTYKYNWDDRLNNCMLNS